MAKLVPNTEIGTVPASKDVRTSGNWSCVGMDRDSLSRRLTHHVGEPPLGLVVRRFHRTKHVQQD
jgi:hypothetical protein